MTAEQQLERSVLESKERGELHAIAQAMSLKTTSRTKKADIIDRILTATGVTEGGNGSRAAANGGSGNGRSRAAAGAAAEPEASPAPPADRAAPADAGAAKAEQPDRTERAAGPVGADTAATTAASATTASPAPGGAGPSSSQSSPASEDGYGGGQGQRGPQSQRPQGRQQQPQHRHQNQPGGAEAGNRRSRRRRGRERGPGGELQGGGSQDAAYQGELVEVRGLLDLRDEGYGFLRCDGYLPSAKDVYVSISQARRFRLRKGDYIEGACRPAATNEKYPALLRIDTRPGLDPEGRATAAAVRGPDAAVPRREAQPGDQRGQGRTSRRASWTCCRRSARASAGSSSRRPRPARPR